MNSQAETEIKTLKEEDLKKVGEEKFETVTISAGDVNSTSGVGDIVGEDIKTNMNKLNLKVNTFNIKIEGRQIGYLVADGDLTIEKSGCCHIVIKGFTGFQIDNNENDICIGLSDIKIKKKI